jgi:hypothetical protein
MCDLLYREDEKRMSAMIGKLLIRNPGTFFRRLGEYRAGAAGLQAIGCRHTSVGADQAASRPAAR